MGARRPERNDPRPRNSDSAHCAGHSGERPVALEHAGREWFFEPASAHRSKGVYGGTEITHGAFADLSRDGFVAQGHVPPSERLIRGDAEKFSVRVDVRLYTYQGRSPALCTKTALLALIAGHRHFHRVD
jgi:hypothetical protein